MTLSVSSLRLGMSRSFLPLLVPVAGVFLLACDHSSTEPVEVESSSAALWSTQGLDNPLLFDADYYNYLYVDLQAAFGGNPVLLRNHWLQSGIYEGRRASPIFDCYLYLGRHADLLNVYGWDCSAAMHHFLAFGLSEGRRGSIEFDAPYYLNRYPDLRTTLGQTAYVQAAQHFMTSGLWTERRAGSNEFDVAYYACHHADLQAAFGSNHRAAAEHYARYGLAEGRRASIHFDIANYLSRYSDLREAYGTNYLLAMYHWLFWGFFQGRIGDPEDGGGSYGCPASSATGDPNAFAPGSIEYNTWNTCTAAQREKINAALAIVHNQFVDNPQPMITCLQNAVFQTYPGGGPEDGNHGEHAEQIVHRMATVSPVGGAASPIPINCDNGSWCPPGAGGCWSGAVHLEPGELAEPIEILASTLAHEIAHGYNYTEAGLSNPLEYHTSIAAQITTCSRAISFGQALVPTNSGENGVSGFTFEAPLQTVGQIGVSYDSALPADREYEIVCPNGMFAQGLDGLESSRGVQSLSMHCVHTNGGSSGQSLTAGDVGGAASSFSQHCNPGEYMTGLWGEAGVTVNTIGPVCAPAWEVWNEATDTRWLEPSHGQRTNAPNWRRICPKGMAVRSLRGHLGGVAGTAGQPRVFDTVQVVCQDLDTPHSLETARQGGFSPDPSLAPWKTTRCYGRGALKGLLLSWFGSTGVGIGRISGDCRHLHGPGTDLNERGGPSQLPGVGRVASLPNVEQVSCGAGEVLVGATISFKLAPPARTDVRMIQGICANAISWATAYSEVPPHYALSAVGPNDGNLTGQYFCPLGQLATGIRVRGNDDQFESLALLCRSFLW